MDRLIIALYGGTSISNPAILTHKDQSLKPCWWPLKSTIFIPPQSTKVLSCFCGAVKG